MTQPEQAPQRPLARWRERRRAKRQEAREREEFARRDPTALAYTDGENRARRFASYGSGGGGDGGGDG